MSELADVDARDPVFPWVPWLLPPRNRAVAHAFAEFADAAAAVADALDLAPAERRERLRMAAAVLEGAGADGNGPPETVVAARLRERLLGAGLALDPARHLVQACQFDAVGVRLRSWSELLNYCRYAAAPWGRQLIALHGIGNEAARPAAEALASALKVLTLARNCGRDWKRWGRLYLPGDWFQAAAITPDHLASGRMEGQTRAVLDRVLDGAEGLLRHVRAPRDPRCGRRLCAQMAALHAHARRNAIRLRHQDPLAGPIVGERREDFRHLAALARGFCFEVF